MLVTALGVPLRLAVDDPVLAAPLHRLTADLRGPVVQASSRVAVRGGGPWAVSSAAWSGEAATRPAALSAALMAVNLTGVASTPHLALHCAVVARGTDAVVLAAASGTGKTTLTAALLQQGWGYASDEALVLPWGGGALEPYARPLALSSWSADQLGVSGTPGEDEVLVTAADLEGRAVEGPLVVRHVVEVVREGRPPGLAPLPRSHGFAALWRRGFTHHRDPARAQRLLTDVVAGAECWRLDLGPPRSQATLLAALC